MEASFTTALDIEECLVGAVDTDVHICVADVVKSLRCCGQRDFGHGSQQPGVAWTTLSECHARVRLRFKLAADPGGTRDGGIPQVCPLSMMFMLHFTCLGASTYTRFLTSLLSCMLITSSASAATLGSCCGKLSSLLRMSGWLGRNQIPLSVSQ